MSTALPSSDRGPKDYLHGVSDLERLVVKAERVVPVLSRNVARVGLKPPTRRRLTDLNGERAAVPGIAVSHGGQNARDVIHNRKAKVAKIDAG